jgi:hypothetical protein
MDVRALLEAGQAKQNADHAALEAGKLGILRGGSAGCIGTDNRVYGECHRVALTRLLGIDKEVEDNRQIMFAAGRSAEDTWAQLLTDAGVSFRREEEIQITWPVPGFDGRVVTGRPDIVIGIPQKDKFVPTFGLELKGIYSAGSAVRVEIEGKPDPKHLAQAGFYSMALGIDYAICYTNPSVWDVPFWAKEARAAGHKKLAPFYRIFYMRWNEDSGLLEYRDENKKHWVQTVYTKRGVASFYATVLTMETLKDLLERPNGGMADGEPMPYDKCFYCPFDKQCSAYEVDRNLTPDAAYDSWVKSCRDSTSNN